MSWPTLSDYQEAIQHPETCFIDDDLRKAEIIMDKHDMPKVISGNFASVYELKNKANKKTKWAVRCFNRPIDDHESRYKSITQVLRGAQLSSMVFFDYIPEGIYVDGNAYPILKMEWIDGIPINRCIEQNLTNNGSLISLAEQWFELVRSLQSRRIAHGDFQNGNILVSNGKLRLIDYDGMYVPSLSGYKSNELGHPNFQHPDRTDRDFNSYLDIFLHGLYSFQS